MIKLSINRPVLTVVTMLLVIILGIISLTRIPLKLIPDINPPVAVVVTSYPNAGPEEVNQKIAVPLERELSTLPGLTTISTQSQEGNSLILMELDWETSVDDIENDVLQRLSNVDLPDDAAKPRFLKFDPSQLPVIQLGLNADSSVSPTEFNARVEELTDELKRINGVASVDANGSMTKQVAITVKPDSLKASGLTFSQLSQLISSSDISLAGTTVREDDQVIATRVLSDVATIESLNKLPLIKIADRQLTLDDVATVKEVTTEPASVTRANGKEAVLVNVLEKSNANTTQVANTFEETLADKLKQPEYKGLQAEVLFSQGDYISRSIQSIGMSLMLGAVFAMAVLFVFLRNIRSPLIIAVAIPYSVIFTFVLMFFADFTVNILTLGGLALGVGMLVDNAIVVIENINRHLVMGKSSKTAALDGAREVAFAVTGSTLTTVVVFLPVVFITGIIGEIFTEFSMTIAFSLIASIIVALTVVPMLAARFLKASHITYKEPFYQRGIHTILSSAIRHKLITLAVVLALIGVSVFGLTRIGTIFLPQTDEGFMTVNVDMGNGTDKQLTEKVVSDMSEVLNKEAAIDYSLSVAGTSSGFAGGTVDEHLASIYIKMKPLDERQLATSELSDRLLPELKKIAAGYKQQAEVSMNDSNSTGTDANAYTFNLSNSSRVKLLEDEKKLTQSLETIDSVTTVDNNLQETTPERVIKLNRSQLATKGLNASEVAADISTMMRGQTLFTMPDQSGDLQDVVIQLPEKTINTNLDDVIIGRQGQTPVTLKQVSTVIEQDAPVSIETIDKDSAIQYTLNLKSGTSTTDVKEAVDKRFDALSLDAGTAMTAEGDQALIDDSMDDMIMALILAAILVYFVMAAQFESFKYPLIIFMTVPLTIIGISLSLWLTKTPFSISVVIGVLVLIGIVVNNGIVLVDFINQRRREGMDAVSAVKESVRLRTRPILMTALTTILGLIPVALGLGDGGEINQPMGITVIGGLLISTLLTLIIIPVIYLLFERSRVK